MHEIVCQLHVYVATMSKISKENLTVFSRIEDTNKLSAFPPCKPLILVGGSKLINLQLRINQEEFYLPYRRYICLIV